MTEQSAVSDEGQSRAAMSVIRADDRLQAVNEREPDSETDPDSWLEWHEVEYKPVSAQYRAAVVAFQGADASFHRMNVLPLARKAVQS